MDTDDDDEVLSAFELAVREAAAEMLAKGLIREVMLPSGPGWELTEAGRKLFKDRWTH